MTSSITVSFLANVTAVVGFGGGRGGRESDIHAPTTLCLARTCLPVPPHALCGEFRTGLRPVRTGGGRRTDGARVARPAPAPRAHDRASAMAVPAAGRSADCPRARAHRAIGELGRRRAPPGSA